MGIIRGKVQHDEWTKVDPKTGRMSGVGYRGYWVNHRVVNGPLLFKESEDGSWYDPKNPEAKIVCMNWSEFCAYVEGFNS